MGGVAQSALAFLVPPMLAIKGTQVWGPSPACLSPLLSPPLAPARPLPSPSPLPALCATCDAALTAIFLSLVTIFGGGDRDAESCAHALETSVCTMDRALCLSFR